MRVSGKFWIRKQANNCTLMPSTHSVTLTQTSENPNGEIVANKTKHLTKSCCHFQANAARVQARKQERQERENETLWPAADVPSAYSNTYVRASPVLEPLSYIALLKREPKRGFKNAMPSITWQQD